MQHIMTNEQNDEVSWPSSMPHWAVEKNQRIKRGERLHIYEFEGTKPQGECNDQNSSSSQNKSSASNMTQQENNGTNHAVHSYRQNHGWKGCDLVHSISSPVRVLEYRVKYANQTRGEGTTLTGLVHFTNMAESHRGYCHGGSMCSIMDDVIGWVGFCATGQCIPWSGFTVQVNTNMMKPVKVGQILMVRATIVKIERRKVYSIAEIVDPEVECETDTTKHKDGTQDDSKKECVHARAEGLVILNRGVLPGH
mmetsp:Transcript_14988/g.28203  ORF Transcript_14988/g.28203 Transcript_14988/m.28203 type:complete len:252 (+) Transcript_14988:166-921(+)